MRINAAIMKFRTTRTLVLTSLLVLPLSTMADDSFWSWFSLKRLKGVAPVSSQPYQDECSACHFAYQPGLLPRRSWQRMFRPEALADHFGENTELDEGLRQALEQYALANAADDSKYKRSRKIMGSLAADAAPLRITEVDFIKLKHSEIPDKLITANPKVGSLSNCNSCHTKAAEGIYDDDTVFIQGYGRWED